MYVCMAVLKEIGNFVYLSMHRHATLVLCMSFFYFLRAAKSFTLHICKNLVHIQTCIYMYMYMTFSPNISACCCTYTYIGCQHIHCSAILRRFFFWKKINYSYHFLLFFFFKFLLPSTLHAALTHSALALAIKNITGISLVFSSCNYVCIYMYISSCCHPLCMQLLHMSLALLQSQSRTSQGSASFSHVATCNHDMCVWSSWHGHAALTFMNITRFSLFFPPQTIYAYIFTSRCHMCVWSSWHEHASLTLMNITRITLFPPPYMHTYIHHGVICVYDLHDMSMPLLHSWTLQGSVFFFLLKLYMHTYIHHDAIRGELVYIYIYIYIYSSFLH